jgi:diphthamide biosynthesis protein 3
MPLYEEIEIEDMTYDEKEMIYWYPCPCGDKFKISIEALWDGEDVADCQSCTLFIEVIYDEGDLPPLPEESDDEECKEKKIEEEKVESLEDKVAVLSI